jgi:transcriptional regulator with XRE-family HTH domain
MPERHLLTNRKAPRTTTGRLTRDMRIALGSEVRRMRVDAGLTQRRLAALADIDHGFLSLVERGQREPSLAVLTAIATALGGTVHVRLHPGTGPRLTDPIQARITEALVRILHRRWTSMLEVPVYRPVRGVIDLVVHDPRGQCRSRHRGAVAAPETRAASSVDEREGRCSAVRRLLAPPRRCASHRSSSRPPVDADQPRARHEIRPDAGRRLPSTIRRGLPGAGDQRRRMARERSHLGIR